MNADKLSISSLNMDQWAQLIIPHLEGTAQGHIYIDLTDQVTQSATTGFSIITLDKIKDITEKKLMNAHPLEVEKGRILLTRVNKMISEEKILTVGAVSNLIPISALSKVSTHELRKIDGDGNFINSELGTEIEKSLDKSIDLTRSVEGTNGVYTLTFSTPGQDIKIKLCTENEVASHLIADKFFQ